MTTEALTTQPSGNTNTCGCATSAKENRSLRGRAFQITSYDKDEVEICINHFNNLKSCDYIIVCHEICPTTGRPHWHGYFHMEQPYKLPKKILKLKTHLVVCFGTPKQNTDYLTKNCDIIFQKGEMPHQGKVSPAELKSMTFEQIEDWRQYNTWAKIHLNDEIDVEDLHKDVEVFYIVGPSGIGKTELAKKIVRDNKTKYGTKVSMAKYENGFWSGVGSNRDVVIYDDFRDSHMKPSEFINFIDYNVHNMNIKGSNVTNNYKLIIITSVQHPKDLYKTLPEEPKQQWLRRLKIIDLEQDPEALI